MDLSLYKDESQIERKTPNLKRKSNVHSSQSTSAKISKRTLLKSKSSSANKKNKSAAVIKRRHQEHDDGDDDKDDEDYSPSKKPARGAENTNARSTPRRKVTDCL